MGDQSAQSSRTYRVPALCAGDDRAGRRAQQSAYRFSRRVTGIPYRRTGNPHPALHRRRLPGSRFHKEAQYHLRIQALSEGGLVREIALRIIEDCHMRDLPHTHYPLPRRKPGDGFTFEALRLRERIEYLEVCPEAKALARDRVIAPCDDPDLTVGDCGEIGAAWQTAAKPSVHVLDATLLPRTVWVTEVGLDRERLAEPVMEGKFGAVVLGEAAAQAAGESLEPTAQQAVDDGSLTRSGLGDEDEARGALLGHEQVLARAAEAYDVSFPVARLPALENVSRAFGDGNTVPDVIDRASSALAEPAAAVFRLRQQSMPVVALGAAEIDIAIDALVADAHARLHKRQPTGDRFGRPSHRKFVSHETAQSRLARQLEAPLPLTPPLRQIIGAQRLIAARPLLRCLAVTLQLPRNRAMMAAL